jgi:uncharacterized membrane protein
MDDIPTVRSDAEVTAKDLVGQPNTAAVVSQGVGSPRKAVLAMVTGLLGLFAMMAVAWALHDDETARRRREQEKRRRNG